MKTTVCINDLFLPKDEIALLNDVAFEKNIEFSLECWDRLFPPIDISIVIDLIQSLSFDVAYDTVKYIFLKLFGILSKAEVEKPIRIICNKKEYIFSFGFQLTEQQQNKIIDAAIEKFLKE